MEETAYAKINLALHVRERLPNGYHRIETLFAFCEHGDALTFSSRPAGLSLDVIGPFSSALSDEPDNLVLAAGRMLAELRDAEEPATGAHLQLDKRLPVAAGLGGGSADAAAAIRLLSRHWQIAADEADVRSRAAALGADIPACIASRTRIGTGTGTDLHEPAADDASGRPVLLVNPGVPLATGPVFARWDGIDRGPLEQGSVIEAALAGRNDLEAPAIALCPDIAAVLAALRATPGLLLARMSGSGATCFGLFEDVAARDAAEAEIAAQQPGWWRLSTCLR